MAEVTNLRPSDRQNLSAPATIIGNSAVAFVEDEDEEPSPDVYALNFDSLSPPNPSFLIDDNLNFTAISESESGSQRSESAHSDRNFLCYSPEDDDDDEDQMNFVTDLFATRHGIPDHGLGNFESGCTCLDEEPELVLGVQAECNGVATLPSMGGLRIVDIESESDSEAAEIHSRVDRASDHDGLNPNYDDLGVPEFWDCLQFDSQRARASLNEEFEWEEVNVRENLSSLIDRIEEISVSSDTEDSTFDAGGGEHDEENARNFEWQVLLAVNNLEIAVGFDEYNMLFGEHVDAESTVKGGPPAAKSVVENLPSVVLTTENLTANDVVCAVCKDEISVGVEVTRLPCCHHYHRDCIMPWLSIRNTCPLCRYELPTDDVDYERRKSRNGAGTSLIGDLRVRYNYQLLP